MTHRAVPLMCVLPSLLAFSCTEQIKVQEGKWKEIDLEITADSCLLEDDLASLDGAIQYSLGELILTPETDGYYEEQIEKDDAQMAGVIEDARGDLWSAITDLDGPMFELAFPPIALHSDQWNADLFMHEDCAGQPTSTNVGGHTSGMVVSSTEIILSSEIRPKCVRNESVFRWCTLEFTSRLVPADG